MDDMASFLRVCFERDRTGAPPIDPRDAGRRMAAAAASPRSPAVDPPSATPTRVTKGVRHGEGPSAVFTVRIAHEDLAVLEQRAEAIGMSPSALARNLIRTGLRGASTTEGLSAAVARVESATAELRAALP